LVDKGRFQLKRFVRLASVTIAAAMFAWAPAAHADTVALDFERGSDGQDAVDPIPIYGDQGVTFSTSHILEDRPDRLLARSGTRALAGWRLGVEFPPSSLRVNFAPAHDVTKATFYAGVAAGYGTGPGEVIRVSATAYHVSEFPGPPPLPLPPIPLPRVVDSDIADIHTDATGAAPISALISLATPSEGPGAGLPIDFISISYESAAQPFSPPPVLIDDLSFETRAALPPPPPTTPPRATFSSPTDEERFGLSTPVGHFIPRSATVPFVLDVVAETRVTAVRISEDGPRNDRVYLLCGSQGNACDSDPPGYGFTARWTDGYTDRGHYEVTATPIDELGREGEAARVGFNVAEQQVDVRVSGRRNNADPVVDDFVVTIRLPSQRTLAHRTLERVSLELHSNTVSSPFYRDRDPVVEICERNPELDVCETRISDAIEVEPPLARGLHDVYRIRFPLPLWHVGVNSMWIHVTTSGEDGRRTDSIREAFSWSLPRVNWGIDHGTTFAPEGIPIRATNCPFVFCKDEDLDGLLDLWESIAVEVLRPTLVFDEGERAVAAGPRRHPSHKVRNFVRVMPVRTSVAGGHILFRFATTYTRDYGDPAFHIDPHNGDTQTMQSLWNIDGDALRLVYVWANRHVRGHVGVFPRTLSWQRSPEDLKFDDNWFLKLWVEEDKHGMWWENCQGFDAPYDCNGGPELRPPAVNAGEQPPYEIVDVDGVEIRMPGRAFIDDLNTGAVSRLGPWADFEGIYPNEFVWTRSHIDSGGTPHFCGGLGESGCGGDHIGQKALQIPGSQYHRSPDDDGALVTPGRAR
jgi:hypothetical protein